MTSRRFPPPWSVEELDACFDKLIRLSSEARRIVAALHKRAAVAEQPPPQPSLREYLDGLREQS